MFAGALSATTLIAQTVPPAPPQQATPAKSPYLFTGDAAITLNFIKADKTADFETIVGKLKEALDDQDDVQHVWSNFDIEEKEIEASLA